MRASIVTSVLGVSLALMLGLGACSKSDNAPTQPGGTWTVSGKTYLTGSIDPVPGVTVKCAEVTGTSGADGSYQLRGVPEGKHAVTAEKANYEKYSKELEVKSDVTLYIYLRTQKSSSLWGYVANAVEGPIEGARVAMDGFHAETDSTGRYEFSSVPQGIYALHISHPNYAAFDTVLSLSDSSRRHDAFLTRDSVMQGTISFDKYVDAFYPDRIYPPDSFSGILYLRANGYDSLGQYHGNVERNIYINFEFPVLLKDPRVSVIEANLQLCMDAPYPSFPVQVFSLEAMWGGYLTYNTQPTVGPLLFSGSVGDTSSAKYWTVLGTHGCSQLVAQYRAIGLTYGVVIKGGVFEPRGFYSTRSSQNQPKITFKVRY